MAQGYWLWLRNRGRRRSQEWGRKVVELQKEITLS